MTQWITVCLCESESRSDPRLERQEVLRCKNCGKPVREQRAGSLTQWIFQQDACDCDRPEIEFSPPPNDFLQPAFHGFDDEGEEEIYLESEKFPTNRYKPISILGEGNGGTVYLSRDRVLGKRVAVKVLRVLDREALMSFQNEAKTTSKLSHPNIVKVLDFGSTHSGVPFMVMELLSGVSLQTIISEQGPLEIDRAVPLFIMISEALVYAHSSNIFHRDIKPSNILVVENEGTLEAHLIDFGVAKHKLAQATTIYNGTALVGTPSYMSPDQALGREFDARSDIYSLGCVLFETVTGVQVFSADTALETIGLHAHETPPSILEFLPENQATLALSKIIEVCLAKDPKLRYASAKALKTALRAVPASKVEDILIPEQVVDKSTIKNAGDDQIDTIGVSKPQIFWTAIGTVVILVFGFSYCCWLVLREPPATKEVKQSSNELPYELTTLKGEQEVQLDGYSGFDMTSPRDMKSIAKGPLLQIKSPTDKSLAELLRTKQNVQRIIVMHSKLSPSGLWNFMSQPLRELSLEDQKITPEHLHVISQLPKLDTLQLGLHKVAGDLDGLSYLSHTKLRNLKISPVKLTKNNLQEIARIKTLERLELSFCTGFSKLSIGELAPLPQLKQLDISSSDVSDATLKQLPALKQLEVLCLNYTQVTDQVGNALANSPKLKRLIFLGCSRVSNASLSKFKEMNPRIQVLTNGMPELNAESKEILQLKQYENSPNLFAD